MSTAVAAIIDAPACDVWAGVEIALLDHFYEPDLEAARAFYAAMAAHDLPGQPVWPMVVAPPSNGKTELIKPMDGLHNVHLIDSVTPNTFISGRAPEKGQQRGKEGLLERIGNRAIMLFPDFSTVLEGNRDKRDEIFSQLRRLCDGDLRREFGIADLPSKWSGRLTVAAAVTPEVDRYTSVFGALGERFVLIRWDRVGGVDAAIAAMGEDQPAKNIAMRSTVHALFKAMQRHPSPEIPPDILLAIAATAEIVARGRTHIKRERDDSILYVPQAEGAARLAQQLCQLAKGSARLDGRDEVEPYDLRIVHRVAMDTLPPQRAALLKALAGGKTTSAVDLPRTTKKRALEDLEHVELLTATSRLREDAQRLFTQAGLTPGSR